ncbi:MAG: hypothetical protein GFH27_549303n160 [Chloroflexi bacterium AL-W]|nr:hypothetical protein [Chloroflexi bacterium AL-N1]NOK68045.1 hypothetical protein [Chloroflexi bacterium AL-N10]NOK73385.1 hypothetical protein [Chloroflexi bacterium AL-N5]NOK83299.1 hypothetical protein [Chloroflexi bacterium AL-W]NOK87716.1 hypothetical protein [Chloroflexi bacterium AL-N15]
MNERHQVPFWLIGVLIALVLILIGNRIGSQPNNVELSRAFAPVPTDPNAPIAPSIEPPQVNLPELPPDIQQGVVGLRDRLAGGESIPALTPVASSNQLQIDITQVRREGDQIHIRGRVSNIADSSVNIPATAFSFRDSAGTTYGLNGNAITTLEPDQSTEIDLSVPLPPDLGLTLIVAVPPDPPIQQILIVETTLE